MLFFFSYFMSIYTDHPNLIRDYFTNDYEIIKDNNNNDERYLKNKNKEQPKINNLQTKEDTTLKQLEDGLKTILNTSQNTKKQKQPKEEISAHLLLLMIRELKEDVKSQNKKIKQLEWRLLDYSTKMNEKKIFAKTFNSKDIDAEIGDIYSMINEQNVTIATILFKINTFSKFFEKLFNKSQKK